jgi:antitoxin PrlF
VRLLPKVRKFLTLSKEDLIIITSKITSKAQTTIPQSVRAALHLKEGDEIAYAIEDARVILTRVEPGSRQDDPFATFLEWDSAADRKAYEKL